MKKILFSILIILSCCFSFQIINKNNIEIKNYVFLKNETLMIYKSNNVYINASKFLKKNNSIIIKESNNIYIYNSIFLNNTFSIYIEKSNNIYIINNEFYKSVNLIIRNSNNIIILNNRFYKNRNALYIFNSSYLEIKNNIFSNNFGDSIVISNSKNVAIISNKINNTKKYKYSSNGINIINSTKVSILFNEILNNYDNGINIEENSKYILILGNLILNNGKDVNSGTGIYISGKTIYTLILFNIFSKNEAQNILIQEPNGWKSYENLPEKVSIIFNIFLPNKENRRNEKTYHITIGSYGNYKNVNFHLNYIILFNIIIGKHNYGGIECYNIFLKNVLENYNIFINCYKNISFLQPRIFYIVNLSNYLNIFGNIKLKNNSVYFINKDQEESFLEINKKFKNISLIFDLYLFDGNFYLCPLYTNITNNYEISFDKKNNQICLNIVKNNTWKNILCKYLKLKKYEKVRIDLVKKYKNTLCVIYIDNRTIKFKIDNIFKNKIAFIAYNYYGSSKVVIKDLKIIEYLT